MYAGSLLYLLTEFDSIANRRFGNPTSECMYAIFN